MDIQLCFSFYPGAELPSR